MKTVVQVVDGLNDLFVNRNIDSLEYDFSREIGGKRVPFFNRMAFVTMEDIRHIANIVAPSEENYPDFTGAIESWDVTEELEANLSVLENGSLYWALSDKDTLRIMIEHIEDSKLKAVFNLFLTIKENILS